MKKATHVLTLALAAVLVLGSQVIIPHASYAMGQNAQTDNNIQARTPERTEEIQERADIGQEWDRRSGRHGKDYATKEEIDKKAHRVKNVVAVRNKLSIAGAGEMSDAAAATENRAEAAVRSSGLWQCI